MEDSINNWTKEVAERLEKDSNSGIGMYLEDPGFTNLADMVESVLKNKNDTVIDLGCGTGRLLQYLRMHSTKDFQYVGIDGSRNMLDIAEKKFIHQQVMFKQQNLLEPLKIYFYTPRRVIVINEVLIHLPPDQQIQVLQNIYRLPFVKHIFLSIQTGKPKVEIVNLEGKQFYNVIQDKNQFLVTITNIFQKIARSVTTKDFPLIPGVHKTNYHITMFEENDEGIYS